MRALASPTFPASPATLTPTCLALQSARSSPSNHSSKMSQNIASLSPGKARERVNKFLGLRACASIRTRSRRTPGWPGSHLRHRCTSSCTRSNPHAVNPVGDRQSVNPPAHTHAHMHARMHAHAHTHMHARMHAHAHMYTRMHTHAHRCITRAYAHTHAHTQAS